MSNITKLKKNLLNLDIENINSKKDYKFWIQLINNIIKSLSKHELNSTVHFFLQSPSHLLITIITVKYYFKQKNLYKTELINLVIANNVQHRSLLSENKYIDDCIHKGLLILSTSTKDRRKKILLPSDKMLIELKDWLSKILTFN